MDASAEAALRHGWNSLWVADHLLIAHTGEGEGGPYFVEYNVEEHEWILEALLSLMYLGARHPKLLLGLGVVVPPMRDAPQLAKEIATLDILTQGRVIVGVGVGDIEDRGEYSNLGKSDRFAVRGRYLEESIALWRHLWAGKTDPFIGRFHELRDYAFAPVPPRGADIPIWTGGRSDRALARIGVLTDGYVGARWSAKRLGQEWPAVVERASRNGRKRPSVATRVRMRMGAEPDRIFSLCGTAEEMVSGLLAFEEAGADEVIAVFEDTQPDDIDQMTNRLQNDVILPYRFLSAQRSNS
jgi:alkanesulfonate monooxygenase SsuD/methylene tetrahydromethanopterin reductase-like flavin-dependent oxidoreductase (luciferase family)